MMNFTFYMFRRKEYGMRRFHSEDTSESESLFNYDEDHRNNASSMSSEVDFQCSTSSEISIQGTSYNQYRVNRRTSHRYKKIVNQKQRNSRQN